MNAPYSPDDSYGPSPGGQRQIQDYLRWFIRRFWIFLVTVIGGYVLGLYIHSRTPETFQSNATIEILRVNKEDAEVDEEERIRMSGAAEMRSISEKLKLPSLYTEIAQGHLFANRDDIAPKQFKHPWESQPSYSSSDIGPKSLGGMMRGWVTVRWRPDTALLDLSVRHSSPAVARDTLVGLLTAYEQSSESKIAGSSEFALDYILESSSEIKERILELDKALRLYNRCMELSREIRATELQIAEMEKRYLPKWPALVEAKELRSILKTRFADELQQVLRLSEEESTFWQENDSNFANLGQEERVDSEIQLVSARSSVIERELEAEQQVYDNLITKLKEGNVSRGFAAKQFDVVQPPNLPGHPVGPDKKRIITKYTAGGAALGVAIILLLGFLDPSLRTVSELEHLTGLSVIGAIPRSQKQLERSEVLAFTDDLKNPVAEAIRTLRAGLTFLGSAEERTTFLVTSAVPGEGKSFVASNLALSFAIQGDRTLLIDADMRRPVQSYIFGYERGQKGLADHLSLSTPLKEIIKRSPNSENLFLLPNGSHSANPAELLSGKGLEPMLNALAEHFDRVIIDSAPLIPVSDSLPLAKLSQSVVLVSRVGKTPKGAIKRALRILSENKTEPVGVVANGLPKTRTKGGYGYYYSYYGGGDYSGYSSYHSEETEESHSDSSLDLSGVDSSKSSARQRPAKGKSPEPAESNASSSDS